MSAMAPVSQAAPRTGQAELDAVAGADRDRSTLTVTLALASKAANIFISRSSVKPPGGPGPGRSHASEHARSERQSAGAQPLRDHQMSPGTRGSAPQGTGGQVTARSPRGRGLRGGCRAALPSGPNDGRTESLRARLSLGRQEHPEPLSTAFRAGSVLRGRDHNLGVARVRTARLRSVRRAATRPRPELLTPEAW